MRSAHRNHFKVSLRTNFFSRLKGGALEDPSEKADRRGFEEGSSQRAFDCWSVLFS